ncbi:MAG: T9SS type A sorting domain-containing protein [Bacteroidales bacterium]|jgi:hypothetical protein|nr:T9SS type A sorting domain-containing protein [Bacteroidales bacterium]
MWDVIGINISGCSFLNSKTINSDGNRGFGIYTEDAKYFISPLCTNPAIQPCPENNLIKCSFQGLYAGVCAQNSGGLNTPIINNAVFVDNSYGVKLKQTNNSTIIKSSFDIGSNTLCPGFTGIGIELKDCNGYCVEENQFFHTPGSDSSANYIGIRVFGDLDNQAVQYNEIYKNIFNGINVANQAEGKNLNSTEQSKGLCYWCNLNQNNIYDMFITGIGIRIHQGNYPDEPAGNCFSRNGNNPYSDINNQAVWPISYLYSGEEPGCQYPVYTYNVFTNESQSQNPCFSHFSGGGTTIDKLSVQQRNELEAEFAENSIICNTLQSLIDNLKDGGNTGALSFDIASSIPSKTMELRNNLLGKSPYLSENILKLAADRYDVLPEAILFEILAANPDELKNDNLIQYMQEKPNPLSEELIEILKSIAGDSTHKTALLEQIATHDSKKMRAANSIIQDMVRDSTTDANAIRNWFANLQSMTSDYQIIDSWLQEKNTISALSLLNLLPQTYNLTGDELIEFNYYKDLKSLQANLITQGRNIFQLNQDEKDILNDIAQNSNGTAGTQAQNILEFGYDYKFLDCAVIAEDHTKSSKAKHTKADNNVLEPSVSAFPNPSNEWCAIRYAIPRAGTKAVIQINDLNGQLVKIFEISHSRGQVVWDVRDVSPGIYFSSLKTEKFIKTGKLIVIH